MWIAIIILGYILNYIVFGIAVSSHPAPSIRKTSFEEKVQLAIPYGVFILPLVAFLLSPWMS